MPRERIAMQHIEEILRLRHEAGRTQREIASGCGMSQSRVQKVLARAWRRPGMPAASRSKPCGAPGCWAAPGSHSR